MGSFRPDKGALAGRNIRPGYIVLKKTSDLPSVMNAEGQVHGRLFHWAFGDHPAKITTDYPDAEFGGFALVNNELRFTSGTLNKGGFGHQSGTCSPFLEALISSMIMRWAQHSYDY